MRTTLKDLLKKHQVEHLRAHEAHRKHKITQQQSRYISFLFYFGKILRCFPVIKITGSVHTTSLLNTTQSQGSQVPNTYMHTYILTYIRYLPNKKQIQLKL